MINVVLAAGYATRMYPLTENFPKPLLEIKGKTILDRMMEDIDSFPQITEHVIVSNHKFITIFQEWVCGARQRYSKPIHLIDDGSISNETRIGAVKDLILAVNELGLNDNLLVAAADNMLNFSLRSLVDYFEEKDSSVIFYYNEPDLVKRRKCGVATIAADGLIEEIEEKPENPKTEHVTPPFYIYHKREIPAILTSVENGCKFDAPGNLARYIAANSSLYAIEMPGQRFDIGSLDTYYALKDSDIQ